MKTVYLVRHGETEGNREKYIQRHDTRLTEDGFAGAELVATRFQKVHIDQLIASHYIRAQQTATCISEKLKSPIITVDSFHEQCQATKMQGQSKEKPETKKYLQEKHERFWNEDWRPAGGENFYDVLGRIEASLQFLEESTAETSLVVSHRSFIMQLIAYVLLGQKYDPKMQSVVFKSLSAIDNVAVTTITFADNRWRLKTYNDHSHVIT